MVRVHTGIPGLDELTEGGFPEKTVNLVSGPTGSAKSLMGMQFVYNGVKDYGEPGIFITLEEPRENIERATKAFNMDLQKYEQEGLHIVDLGEMRKEYSAKEELEWGIVDFKTLTEFLENHIKSSGVKRIVIDSISAISLYYSGVDQLRREMFRFCRLLKDKDVTTLLISESSGESIARFDVEQFVADSLIALGYENVDGEYRRTITVYKMRFTRHDPYKHPFLIKENGIEVAVEEILY